MALRRVPAQHGAMRDHEDVRTIEVCSELGIRRQVRRKQRLHVLRLPLHVLRQLGKAPPRDRNEIEVGSDFPKLRLAFGAFM